MWQSPCVVIPVTEIIQSEKNHLGGRDGRSSDHQSLKWQRKNQVDVLRRKANIISKYRLELVPWPLEIHLKRDMLPFSFVYLPVKFHSLCSLGGEMKVRNETCSFTSNPAREQPSKCGGCGLPGGPGAENLPSNAGDLGLIPGWGT